MTATTDTTIVLALATAPSDGATIAALRLAEAAIERGHRVAVYAYGDGVGVGSVGRVTGDHVRALLRRGVHGGRLSWVVDERDPRSGEQVAGVVRGDASDLWHLVRDGDVVLGVAS
jgi:hypothetical protein